MYRTQQDSPYGHSATIYCTDCGGAMQVAAPHMHMLVACPHCQQPINPQRFILSDGRTSCSWRNRWVAGILGVLLGAFGIHRMYMGYMGIGIIQMIVSFVTLGIGGLWGFIEGVLCLAGVPMKDARGLPLNDRNPFAGVQSQNAAF